MGSLLIFGCYGVVVLVIPNKYQMCVCVCVSGMHVPRDFNCVCLGL